MTGDGFEEFMRTRKEASDAFVDGKAESLDRISAHKSPATLFGPKGDCIQGAGEVNAANAKGSSFSSPVDATNSTSCTRAPAAIWRTGQAYSGPR